MESILIDFFKLFKELSMEFGFWKSIFALGLLIVVFNLTWKLPNIITAVKEFLNKR